jgi:hypothetical protein
MLTISTLEDELSRHGKFCILDWLLAQNLLCYSDYEAWRYGNLETLDKKIDLDNDKLNALFMACEKHAKALGLTTQSQEHYSWRGHGGGILSTSNKRDTHKQLTQHWLRPQDLPQLDLFMDNSTVIAENTLLRALGGRQWQEANKQLQLLTQLHPAHQRLGSYQDLLNYGSHMQSAEQIDSPAIAAELQALQEEVLPLAKEVLGDHARDYLAFAWRRLADNLQSAAFDPAQPALHRSYALRQIPDWTALEHTLNNDPQRYQYPQLIEHLATSAAMLKQPAKALLLWCMLVEKFSTYADTALEENKDQTIYPLWQQFWDLNDGWPVSFFPAFVFLKQPGLIHHLETLPAFENRATLAMIVLLKCRQKRQDEISARETLQNISPALLRLYLQLRSE